MLRGFTTITYFVDDLPAAITWYTRLFGVEPYFVRPTADDPAYAEFRIGDNQDEFGLISSDYRPAGLGGTKPAGAVTYWHVDHVPEALERLTEMGASVLEPIITREQGWVTATVADPFGNVLGLMYSPHYLDMLARVEDVARPVP